MNWFCQSSGLNCIDLQQAISDIGLQLNVTTIFLLLLFVVGILFGWLSHWLSTRKKNRKQQALQANRTGLRVRLRRPQPAQPLSSWWADFWQGISTEFFGAVVTTILLGLGVLVFEQYQDIQNRQNELILQMVSPNNDFAIEAVRQLRDEGWLSDGTLSGANLLRANLTDANLGFSDLTGANLFNADLTDANLFRANLTYADLGGANLTDARLSEADLANAYLVDADLTDANIARADLTDANLRLANLTDVLFSLETILPDGTNWAHSTDMTRFTDREHPQFWNICIEVIPAPRYCEG